MQTPNYRRFSLLLAVVLASQAVLSGMSHRHCGGRCGIGDNHLRHSHSAASACSHHAAHLADSHSQPPSSQPKSPVDSDDDDCIACRFLAQRVLIEVIPIELACGESFDQADLFLPIHDGGSAPSLQRCRAPPAC